MQCLATSPLNNRLGEEGVEGGKLQEDLLPYYPRAILNISMTVCIAALAENGNKVVLVADKMITTAAGSIGNINSEIDDHKIVNITTNKYILMSGWISNCLSIIDRLRNIVQENNSTVECANLLLTQTQILRNEWIESGILRPRGLTTLSDYYGRHLSLLNTLTSTIDKEIQTAQGNFNQNVSFIVVGKDGDSYNLYRIDPANIPLPTDQSGFISIGSGGGIANYAMIDLGYKKSFDVDKVKKIALKAKQKSERAPGVGKGAQMIILGEESTLLSQANII